MLCEITHDPLKMLGGVPRTDFRFRSCYHCEAPHCVAVCPTGAMQKRADGIVFVDQERCIGCTACAGACPWGVPERNPSTGKAVKCDYCMDRLDAGLNPACVTRCTTHALKLVSLQEL
jgi:Fe-S-cluster-containing dehydrogenase component